MTHNQSELDMNRIEEIIADHNKAMRADIASEIAGGTRSKAITDVITAKAILAYITANYTPNSEVQDLVNNSVADAADEASKAAINQLTMGGEWIPASEVAERERVARINEGQLFREAMIEHSTPAIYWGDRLDELREDKL